MPKLETLNLTYCEIKLFPVLKMKSLKSLDLSSNPIESLENLKLCVLPALTYLWLNYLDALVDKVLPPIMMPSLANLYLQNASLEAIDGLTFSKLDSL